MAAVCRTRARPRGRDGLQNSFATALVDMAQQIGEIKQGVNANITAMQAYMTEQVRQPLYPSHLLACCLEQNRLTISLGIVSAWYFQLRT